MSLSPVSLSAQGPAVSPIALGAWRLADEGLQARDIQTLVHACVECGITTIDHADIYGDYSCERLFGAAIGPGLRDRLQLITKCGIHLVSPGRPSNKIKSYDTTRLHVLASVDNSLKQLRTDRIDLLLIHRPDPLTDPDELAGTFVELKSAGKVLHFGVSNFSVSQFELLASRLPFPLVTNQLEFSLLHPEPMYDGTFDQCLQRRISPMAWSPLAGGRILLEESPAVLRLRQALNIVGQELGGASADQVALAWILRHPARVVVIIGTTNIARMRSAAAAVELNLSRPQWFTLLKAATGTDVL